MGAVNSGTEGSRAPLLAHCAQLCRSHASSSVLSLDVRAHHARTMPFLSANVP